MGGIGGVTLGVFNYKVNITYQSPHRNVSMTKTSIHKKDSHIIKTGVLPQ